MEWRKSYLDLVLVPLGFLITIAYHVWLWHKVRTEPMTTTIGRNAYGRRFWVGAMMKVKLKGNYCSPLEVTWPIISSKVADLVIPLFLWGVMLTDMDKKNIVAVQTLRNLIMGSTLMATTSILVSAGLGAVISSTYSVKKPLNDSLYGAHGEFMVALKYVALLTIFLFSFFCHSLSIRFLNQVSMLICIPQDPMCMVTAEYLTELLERGSLLNTVGNRLFYAAIPLLLWIFGPVLVFLCFAAMVPVLYNLDFMWKCGKGWVDQNGSRDFV